MDNTIKPEKYLVITFDSTAFAYAMEKARREDNLEGRLIPLPKSISAGCGASFATKNFDRRFWQEYMAGKGISFSGFYDVEL